MSARPVQNAEESRKGLTMKTSTEQQTPSQRAMSDVERVAEAIWRTDTFRMGDPEAWTGDGDQRLYRAMAVASIEALGVREEQYRSAACPDDQDYDMVRLCGNWRPVREMEQQ